MNYLPIKEKVKEVIKTQTPEGMISEEEKEVEEKKYSELTDEQITKMIDMIDEDKADDFESWRNGGFALFNELGKDGRPYYHQFSKKSNKYNKFLDKIYLE